MSKFGALISGFGTGFATGQKMKLDRERADRDNKTADLQNQAQQRALDKDQKLQDAYQDIANEAVKRSGVQIPAGPDTGEPGVPGKQPSAQEALGFALHSSPDLFKDREFLNTAASAFLSRGLPDGVKWLEAGHKASQEGYTQALQALMNDDAEGAVKAFASSGKMRGVTSVDQLKKLENGQWEIAGANGKTMTIDPKQAYINLLPPKDFAEFQMKAPYYKALSEYQGGRNEAGVTRAEVGADSRVEAAGIRAGGQVDAAGVRAGVRPGAGARGPSGAGGTSMYGGDKGAAKWVDDFEKHYIPTRDVKNADGSAKVDPKSGQPIQEVDAEVAPVVRDMARVNRDVLASGGIHPQEAANVFTQFARAFKTGDRAKMFGELDKGGRIAIVENKDGDPVKAMGIMGQYRDERGQVRPMLFELPDGMSTELITQEAINRGEKGKAYPDEGKRGAARNVGQGAKASMMRTLPGSEPPDQAPDAAVARSLDSAKDAVKSVRATMRSARSKLLGYGLAQRRTDPDGFKKAQGEVANAESKLVAAERAEDVAQKVYEASFGNVSAVFARRGLLQPPPRQDLATVE